MKRRREIRRSSNRNEFQSRTCRPRVEKLEDRSMLTAIVSVSAIMSSVDEGM